MDDSVIINNDVVRDGEQKRNPWQVILRLNGEGQSLDAMNEGDVSSAALCVVAMMSVMRFSGTNEIWSFT